MTEIIQEAVWATTNYEPNNRQTKIIPLDIFDKKREKRKAKAKWQKRGIRENKKHEKKIKSKIKDHLYNEFSKFID